MIEELENTPIEITDEQAQQAAGGSQGPDHTFTCLNCGEKNTVLSEGAGIQEICQYCGYNNSTRKKSPYDGK